MTHPDKMREALRLYIAAGFGMSTDFRKQGEAYDAAMEALASAPSPQATCVGCAAGAPFNATVQADEARDAGLWISVEERMPPKFEEVLIAFRDVPLPATGQYTASPHDTWGWCFPKENDPEETGPITHWMQLPDPPAAMKGPA